MKTNNQLFRPNYRSDIDGLRGIAILAVVAFHAFPKSIRGGFVGVDIFFVISGFLISTIIIQSLNNGNFNLLEFYSRRIKRIFPGLILVLLSIYILGYFVLLPDEYKQLGKHIAGSSAFISNFVLLGESGYFDNSGLLKPTLHLWSLAIEEQFYLFFPIALYIFWKRRISILLLTFFCFLISFFLNLRNLPIHPTSTFYLPQTRFWELFAGTILACLTKKNNFKELPLLVSIQAQLKNGMSFLGILLLLFGLFTINSKQFPGKFALVPVISAAMLIAAGPKSYVNKYLLSNKLFVWFGLISFPLYLWHWPIISFAHIVNGTDVGWKLTILLLAISVFLAWTTYFFIERPVRLLKSESKTPVFLAVILVLLGLLGGATYFFDGIEARFYKRNLIVLNKIQTASNEWSYPGRLTRFYFQGETYYTQKSGVSAITLYIGDSNVEQYYDRIEQQIKENPEKTNTAVFITGGGCFPIPFSPHDIAHNHCFGLMEKAKSFAIANSEVRNVVIAGLWTQYFLDGAALDGDFGYGSQEYKNSIKHLVDYVKELRKSGKKVFLILNIPVGERFSPRFMVKRDPVISLRPRPNSGVDRKTLDAYMLKLQKDLRDAAKSVGADVIEPFDYLCNDLTCIAVDSEGDPVYKDGYHLRPSYVRGNATFIDLTLK